MHGPPRTAEHLALKTAVERLNDEIAWLRRLPVSGTSASSVAIAIGGLVQARWALSAAYDRLPEEKETE